jgi:hypothetical protein
METRLQLRYSGHSVDQGRMDVYAASANMIAFSEFMVAAVKATYGNEAQARAEVAGYGKGSFLTDICFTVGGPLATLFSTDVPKNLLECVKGAFELWKFLHGSPPEKIQNHGQQVSVTNNNGQILQIQTQSLNLVLSDKGADAVSRFVGSALSSEGVDTVSICIPEDKEVVELVSVKSDEAPYFKQVEVEKPVAEFFGEMALIIESAVFKDGNKWRFSDGSNSFNADIEDEAFLKRVEDGERFGKGDVLRVKIKIAQSTTGIRLSVQRTIMEVIEHQDRQFQPVLI